MKNLKFYLSVSILILGLQTFAQNEKISIGVKLLPGISKSNGVIKTNFKFSMGGGVQFVTNFNETIGIESGLYFRNYGYGVDEAITDEDGYTLGNFNVKYNYNYLSLPVLFRLNINSFYFALGTNINLFITGNINYQGQDVMGTPGPNAYIENAKSIVIEPNLNCGYQFAINNKFGLNLEGRSSFTVNGILQNTNTLKLFNLGFGIGFCYFITPRE